MCWTSLRFTEPTEDCDRTIIQLTQKLLNIDLSTMIHSNALRKLEETLTKAIENGNRQQASGTVLLESMNIGSQARSIVDFYELLNKVEEEARSLKSIRNIDRYLSTIEQLQEYFIVNHIWAVAWDTFANYIETKNVLNTLDSLAEFYYRENPAIILEKDFLEKLNSEFTSLLDEIIKSDLSRELKTFLTKHIEKILKAIRRYHIDGTEGLKNAAQSLVSDLVMRGHTVKDLDKNNPKYRRVQAWGLSFLLYIAPSPYDIIGAVPDIYDFWIPKFEELAKGREKIEKIIEETPNIQEACEKASHVFDRQAQKSIAGSGERKALPASKEDSEDKNDQ
jgi:hypothetical protein